MLAGSEPVNVEIFAGTAVYCSIQTSNLDTIACSALTSYKPVGKKLVLPVSRLDTETLLLGARNTPGDFVFVSRVPAEWP